MGTDVDQLRRSLRRQAGVLAACDGPEQAPVALATGRRGRDHGQHRA